MALLLARSDPALLRSLILADPAPLDSMLPASDEGRAQADARSAVVSAALGNLQQGQLDTGLETFIDGVVAPGAWKSLPEPARQTVRENAWSIKSLPADAKTPYACADASAVKVPVLLITGEKSPRPYGVMLDALASCFQAPRRVTIPGASHVMNRSHAPAFNAAVLGFLGHVPAAK